VKKPFHICVYYDKYHLISQPALQLLVIFNNMTTKGEEWKVCPTLHPYAII